VLLEPCTPGYATAATAETTELIGTNANHRIGADAEHAGGIAARAPPRVKSRSCAPPWKCLQTMDT
jgi:hypothetical protein